MCSCCGSDFGGDVNEGRGWKSTVRLDADWPAQCAGVIGVRCQLANA